MRVEISQILYNVIVCGDIHGEFMTLVNKIERYNIENSLIIVAGDVGIGFHKDGYYSNMFTRMSKRLSKRNNILFFVRGNHDDPDKWNDYKPLEKYWQEGDYNIRLIKDYTVITVKTSRKQHNILCVGGAISVDRTDRVIGRDYWLGEQFVYDESKVSNLVGLTDVITHSCPDFCEPIIKGTISEWMEKDVNLESDCNKERQDHTLLYNKLKEKNKIDKWVYGHYHFTSKTYVDDTLFRLCDIMELVEL